RQISRSHGSRTSSTARASPPLRRCASSSTEMAAGGMLLTLAARRSKDEARLRREAGQQRGAGVEDDAPPEMPFAARHEHRLADPLLPLDDGEQAAALGELRGDLVRNGGDGAAEEDDVVR